MSRAKIKKAYSDGWEVFSRMKKFLGEGRSQVIAEEVSDQLKKSIKYGFNHQSAEFASFLQYYYLTIAGDKRRGEKYHKQALYYTQLSKAENLVKIKFSRINFLLNQTRKPNADTIAQLEETIKEIDVYNNLESIEILIYRTTLANILDFTLNRHEQVINRCCDKIDFLKKLKIERYFRFYTQVAPSLIFLGRYNKANDAISNSLSGIPKSSLSWTVSIYYKFVTEAHQKNYKNALSIFIEAEQKEHISETMRQTWYIIRGFVKFLNLANKIDYPKPFRLENFLQNVDVFKSDKLGQNINVLILKILLRLKDNRGAIIDERDAIQKYANRYLKSEPRAKTFFKQLHLISYNDFDPARIRSAAVKNNLKLPPQKGYNPNLEIIPYEHLWEIILDVL